MVQVLLIDDDLTDRTLFRYIAHETAMDLEIDEASNGTQGLERIKAHEYDCVFIDYMLPDIDGIDLLKKIYNPETELAPFPVVVLTGQGHESIIIDAIQYGAQDYLTKNHLTPDSLMMAIEKARHVFNIKRNQNETKLKLNHSQKLEALGKLTGGIAHDFNNILTIILGNTRLMQDILENDEFEQEGFLRKSKTIEKAAERGADLVEHLMAFSHHRSLNPEPSDLNNLLNSMGDLLKRTIGQAVTILNNFADDLWLTNLDPAQLEHMVINISANARDAMPDGGTLSLQTYNTSIPSNRAQKLNISPGDYVCLSITDTGIGISKEIQDKIFDPFFTTKEVGKGTGLGMSTAYGFIRECGGTIEINSRLGQGTEFIIYFPKSSSEEVSKLSITETKVTITDGQETILVVEDEEEIKNLAAMILKGHGYTVLQASDASEALEILQDENQHLDLLFTDIMMPGEMNGVQLAARALVLRPNIPILFTTGYIQASIPDVNLLSEYTILNKPYKPDALLQEIQKALQSGQVIGKL